MNTDPHWTAYLSALLAPVVAVLGSLIAYRQWRLAQNKLKLDLFDRRLKIYEAATGLISSIMTSGKANDAEVFKYMVATREAKWLLNPEIAEYLDKQLYHKAIDLQTLDAELEGVPVGDVRTKNVRAQAELKKWLMAQYPVLDAQFSPFLQLRH
jgi:hypothetical protein